jgi:hypothetical protein
MSRHQYIDVNSAVDNASHTTAVLTWPKRGHVVFMRTSTADNIQRVDGPLGNLRAQWIWWMFTTIYFRICLLSAHLDINIIPVVTICTARFNIHKFHVLPTQCMYVLYGSENKERLFPFTTLTGFHYWESLLREVSAESLNIVQGHLCPNEEPLIWRI